MFNFLLATFLFSYALQFYVIFNGGIHEFGTGVLVGLMWIPGMVSLFFRTINKDWKDIGLKLGSIKFHLLAFFVPCIGAFFSAFICSLFDIRVMSLPEGVPISKITLQFTLVFIMGLFAALGEEIGWRGYLVPKVYDTKIKYPTIFTGLVWALWHIPIVAFSGYYETLSPLMVILLYTAAIFGFNYFINWLRMASGSMWVATLTHASYNFFFQTFWLYLLFKEPGPNKNMWEKVGGDVGIIPILIFAFIAAFGHFNLNWSIGNDSKS